MAELNLKKLLYKIISNPGIVGEIKMWGGNSLNPPNGWHICDGSVLLIADYPALYSVIGNIYEDSSDPTDSSHFRLPNLIDRTVVGSGNSYSLGATGGSPYLQAHRHSFTNPTVPNHTHTFTYNADSGAGASGDNPSGRGPYVRRTASGGATSTFTLNSSGSVGTTNGAVNGVLNSSGESMSTGDAGNMPPYLAINYIINLGTGSIFN